MQFTNEELNNILALINRANITGQEAIAVAVLQQKIQGLLKPVEKEEDGKYRASFAGRDPCARKSRPQDECGQKRPRKCSKNPSGA